MKKLLVAIFCLTVGVTAASAQNSDPNGPKFQFTAGETYDFGEVVAGPDVVHKFEFTNTGKQPLVIQGATASCSCTVPDWPKEPILPGKMGVINVVFHSAGKSGPIVKDIYIQSNAVTDRPRYELHLKGSVKEAKKP